MSNDEEPLLRSLGHPLPCCHGDQTAASCWTVQDATRNTTQLGQPVADEDDRNDCNYALMTPPPLLSAVSYKNRNDSPCCHGELGNKMAQLVEVIEVTCQHFKECVHESVVCCN